MIIIKELNEFTRDMVRCLPKVNYFINKGKKFRIYKIIE